jgi:hypothetical protein
MQKEKLGMNYRVTHYNDPVPRLPPGRLGYAQYLTEFYIGTKNNQTAQPSDVLNLTSSNTQQGNEQFILVNIEAHKWYFNNVTACWTANMASNDNKTANDLSTKWASTIMTRMGNTSGLILEGDVNKALTSTVTGLLTTVGSDVAKLVLGLIPGGTLIMPLISGGNFSALDVLLPTGPLLSAIGSLLSTLLSTLAQLAPVLAVLLGATGKH